MVNLTLSPHLPLRPSRDLHRGTAVCVHSDGGNPAVSVSAEPRRAELPEGPGHPGHWQETEERVSIYLIPWPRTQGFSTPDFISQLSGFSQKLWDKIQSRRPRFEAMNSQALLSSSYYSMQTELKMGRRRSYGEPWSTGTPEKWLSKTLQTLGPECFCMYLCIIEPPEMQKPLYFIKRTGFSVPLVSGLYKICWIMRTFACLTHKILHHCWTIQKLDTIIALVHTVLASG